MWRVVLPAVLLTSAAAAQQSVRFERDVLPVLEQRCFRCHRGVDGKGRKRVPKGGLRLDGSAWILRGGDLGPALVPGDPGQSSLYQRIVLPDDDDEKMPAKGKPTTPEENELLRAWIAQGADFGGWVGQPGPAAEAEAAPARLPQRVAEWARLAEGVRPLPPEMLEKVAERAEVTPVVPGSPLLRVAFRGEASDRDVAALAPLAEHVAHLDLGRTQVTDVALGAVGRMPRLAHLDLRRTAITDAGLEELSGLGELRYLNLYGTVVTDRGMAALHGLEALQAVYLWGTRVTDAGVEALRQALPRARVQHVMALPGSGAPRRRG